SDHLLRASRTKAPGRELSKPRWDGENRELRFDGEVIRRVRGRTIARNVVRVLDAFQEDDWPSRIDNPVHADKVGIHEIIKSLNAGLRRIRFRGDGTGEGIVWGPIPDA